MKFDFVSIGDIVTDAFIGLRTDNTQVTCDIDGRPCQLSINFGDKLEYNTLDVIPAVGNSPNASVSAHRLGLSSALVTNIGDDRFGKEDLEALKKEGVSTDFVKVHKGRQSNYHFVLRVEAERTILVKHEEYTYEIPNFDEAPSWIYFSSVGENSIPFHHEIAKYVTENNVKLAFQPGTFQIKLGYEKLKDVYGASELFFCNKEEAKRILKTDTDDMKEILKEMHALGPSIAIITDGPKGAYAYDGKEGWHMPMYPDPAPPVDRTGAGDSFSSTFTSALALGHDIPTALSWGPINSMSVVQHVGAQKGLLSLEELKKHLENAPEDYKPEKII